MTKAFLYIVLFALESNYFAFYEQVIKLINKII